MAAYKSYRLIFGLYIEREREFFKNLFYFQLFLVIAFVIGVVVYRIVFSQVLYRVDNMKPYANLITFSTAATLNLAVILVLSYVSL